MAQASWRILLVDDNSGDLELTRILLTESSRTVVVDQTSRACEALSMLADTQYDCMLLDYGLAEGNALDVFADYLSQPSGERVPVVIQTSADDATTAVAAMKRGVEDYIAKTAVDSNLLVRTIDSAIIKAQAARQLTARAEQLERMSWIDELTQIPNRRCFDDRLEQALRNAGRSDSVLAVLVMDLDGFKEINDTLGHAAGDEVLRTVAERMTSLARKSDTVARFGGDEFAMLLPTAGSVEGAATLARRTCDVVSESMSINGDLQTVGVSIGIAMFPDHGRNAEDLLARADTAMYQAKRSREGYRIFDAGTSVASISVTDIVGGVQRGIDQHEFVMQFQPQVSLQSGHPRSMEALLRWQHPEFDLLLPDRFIPGLERTNSICDLTLHSMELVANQMRSWRDAGERYNVAVNLSACALEQDALPRHILAVFERHRVPPQQVTLEVTESGIMRYPAEAARSLGALSECGFRISIDDFGAGQTSLSFLTEIKLHEIKIDRQFVQPHCEGRRRAIVKAIIELAHGLGVDVVAEGIESIDQFRGLRDLGCGIGQG